jgi:hypothetical protein
MNHTPRTPGAMSSDSDVAPNEPRESSDHTPSDEDARSEARSNDSAEAEDYDDSRPPILVVLCKSLDLDQALMNSYVAPPEHESTPEKARDMVTRLPSFATAFLVWSRSAHRASYRHLRLAADAVVEGVEIVDDLEALTNASSADMQAVWDELWSAGLTSFVREVVLSRESRASEAYVLDASEVSSSALESIVRLSHVAPGIRSPAVLEDAEFNQCMREWARMEV